MKILIKAADLNYSIPYGKTILKDINFELHEGKFLGVLGRNGVGKTTLMDLILGFRPVTSGTIEILSENPTSFDRKNLTEICFLSQDNVLKGSLSIRQFLNFYSSLFPKYSIEEELRLLEFFSLKDSDKIGTLSTGQQKKVQIAGALASMPKLLLIDEITAVLDPETRGQFFSSIERHRVSRGMGIVLATNIAEDLISKADDVLFIDNSVGSIRHPSEILNLFNVEKSA